MLKNKNEHLNVIQSNNNFMIVLGLKILEYMMGDTKFYQMLYPPHKIFKYLKTRYNHEVIAGLNNIQLLIFIS